MTATYHDFGGHAVRLPPFFRQRAQELTLELEVLALEHRKVAVCAGPGEWGELGKGSTMGDTHKSAAEYCQTHTHPHTHTRTHTHTHAFIHTQAYLVGRVNPNIVPSRCVQRIKVQRVHRRSHR